MTIMRGRIELGVDVWVLGHEEPGTKGGMPSVRIFLRDPYLRKFWRKPPHQTQVMLDYLTKYKHQIYDIE